MGRTPSKGQYTPLSARYFWDDAILEAGEHAELLWVRCLAFLAGSDSDGFITDRQMTLAVGARLRGVPKRVATLIEVGLLEKEPGGYVARSWLKWNKSAETLERKRAEDRDRKAKKAGEEAPNSARNVDGIQTDSSAQYKSSQVKSDNVPPLRADVSRLCTALADGIEKNGSKRPTIGKGWHDAARLMLDSDSRPMGEALELIQWCQADPFWRANVLSMPKFREKYDTLRLQRSSKPIEPETKPKRVFKPHVD